MRAKSELTIIQDLVAKSKNIQEALNNCENKDIIFVSNAIRKKFNLTEEQFNNSLAKYRFSS